MKIKSIHSLTLAFASIFATLFAFGADEQHSPSLTLYNQHFGVVREMVPLKLASGINEMVFSEITAHLEPQSIILSDPRGAVGVRILEQNYLNDPVSQELLLQHFEGQEIDFERTVEGELKIVRGRIVRAPYLTPQDAIRSRGNEYMRAQMMSGTRSGSAPIIEIDGQLRFTLPGLPIFPALADDTIMKPTLHWQLEALEPFEGDLEISYLSGGFSWAADYNLLLPQEGNVGALIGWVSMENYSGRNFENARIKLMAGEVSRVEPARRDRGQVLGVSEVSVFAARAQEVQQRAFDEYHLYTLPRKSTLRNRETKQVEFVRSAALEAQPQYIYNGSGIRNPFLVNFRNNRDNQAFGVQSNSKVWVYRLIDNSRENGLGIPLPAGKLRLYREDIDGAKEFIGENMIEHTPRDETLRLYTGDAFDLVGERVRVHFEINSSRNTIIESFEIKVRNRKEHESVSIYIVEPLYRWSSWEITEHSALYRQIDSQTIDFLVKLEPGQEKVVTYTVRYFW